MRKLSKFIGNSDFYKMVLMIAVPIMIQNGITNFVSLLDNIMIGQVGTEQMSGVAIVNQLIFVYEWSFSRVYTGILDREIMRVCARQCVLNSGW